MNSVISNNFRKEIADTSKFDEWPSKSRPVQEGYTRKGLVLNGCEVNEIRPFQLLSVQVSVIPRKQREMTEIALCKVLFKES